VSDSNSPSSNTFVPLPKPLSNAELWQIREEQYIDCVRSALQDIKTSWRLRLPANAGPLELATAVREFIDHLLAERLQPYRSLFREQEQKIHALQENDWYLKSLTESQAEQIKALSETVARLQDRLDRGGNSGRKGL